jgi:ribonuclease-3
MEGARRFVETHIDPEIEEVASGESGDNYKSDLQHFAQREFGCTPTYIMVDQKGPDHNKSFKVAAQVGQNTFAPAWGRSKKEAEQKAAKKAIEQYSGATTEDSDAEPADADAD